jgi:hypothetical protein
MALLWLPDAIRKPIAAGPSDPLIVPVGDVFHVAVTEGSTLFGNFISRTDGVESTGYIRRDGTVEQYRPLNVQCDAQAAGNSWSEGGRLVGLNSWETQGMGPGEWTDAQLATIKRIIVLKHREWGVPLRVCPTATSAGIGYHRLFDAWNPHNHSCPGPDRVRQFEQIIVPWLARGAQEDDMPSPKDWSPEDWAAFDARVDARLAAFAKDAGDLIKVDGDGDPDTPKVSLERKLRNL